MNKFATFLLKNIIKISFIILLFYIIGIIYFSILKPFNDWSFRLNPELFSQYGNFIGGLFGSLLSLITIAFLYISITDQRERNKLESFENTFFNLLKSQQEITNSLNAYFPHLNENFYQQYKQVSGKEFFLYSIAEIKKIHKSINQIKYSGRYDESDLEIYNHQIEELYDNQSIPNELKNEEAKSIKQGINIQYVNKRYEISKDLFNKIVNEDDFNKIKDIYKLYFNKYRYAIGHYFRHLYHIILFVKEHGFDEKQSKKYIDFIQAQMSSFELTLLYYNLLLFPKMKELVIEFDFLDNLFESELIDPKHNCIKGVILKTK